MLQKNRSQRNILQTCKTCLRLTLKTPSCTALHCSVLFCKSPTDCKWHHLRGVEFQGRKIFMCNKLTERCGCSDVGWLFCKMACLVVWCNVMVQFYGAVSWWNVMVYWYGAMSLCNVMVKCYGAMLWCSVMVECSVMEQCYGAVSWWNVMVYWYGAMLW